MNNAWQAIEFIEGQTVAEFVKQFEKFLDKDATIPWSCLGGIFENAMKHPSEHDGRVRVHLPLSVTLDKYRKTQETQ